MFVELKGAGNHNKGAEKMLLTCLQYLGDEKTKFVYKPVFSTSDQYEFYSGLGLYPKMPNSIRGVHLDFLANLVPRRIKQAYGLVSDQEVEAIVDISGFAYSDQWGVWHVRRMARDVKRWKKGGKKVILMPQAFGPFEISENIRNMRTIIELSDVIFARDVRSYQYLCAILNDPKIRIAPDFTALLDGVAPDYFDENIHQVCIAPNQRMMDKLDVEINYIDLMVTAIDLLKNEGVQPFFLVTGGQEDLQLSETINKKLSADIPIVVEGNPMAIKGLIKKTRGMFGSRFHSLASALYAGVPAISLGWSHKYEHLYSDLGFTEGYLSIPFSENDLREKLQIITDEKRNMLASASLKRHVDDYKSSSVDMFSDVNKILLEK